MIQTIPCSLRARAQATPAAVSTAVAAPTMAA